MATGGSDQPITGGHEIFYEWRCNKCEESDCMVEAIGYCRNCAESYCDTCLGYHNKFVRGHTVLGEDDKHNWGQSIASQDSGMECSEHKGQYIAMYCENHDVVCCPVCAYLHHGESCKPKMSYIPTVAQGIVSSAAFKNFVATNDELLARILQAENARTDCLPTLNTSRESCLMSIESIEEKLIRRIGELKEISISGIHKLFENEKRSVQTDIAQCVEFRQELSSIKQQMQTRHQVNESSFFVKMKTSGKIHQNCDQVCKVLSKKKMKTYSIKEDSGLQQLFSIQSLGECSELEDHQRIDTMYPPADHSTRLANLKTEVIKTEGEKKITADESCVICMDKVTNPKTMSCGHVFCTECIDMQVKYKPSCPTCSKVFGVITGDQPEGTLFHKRDKYKPCAGYEGYGSISITYRFPAGIQGDNHPNPGKWYDGISRTAFLPDNEECNIVHEMLKIAFDRKLVFTIGSSRTTGQEGVITWNDIHHKTNPNPRGKFGYPDAEYLTRVTNELASKGVTKEDIQKDTLRDIQNRFRSHSRIN